MFTAFCSIVRFWKPIDKTIFQNSTLKLLFRWLTEF
jgi:hypothetical protein